MTPEETERLNALLAIDAGALTVPRPTPDEDGRFNIAGYDVSHAGAGRVALLDPYGSWPEFSADDAEALGAALIAAAQDARRIAAEAAQEETPMPDDPITELRRLLADWGDSKLLLNVERDEWGAKSYHLCMLFTDAGGSEDDTPVDDLGDGLGALMVGAVNHLPSLLHRLQTAEALVDANRRFVNAAATHGRSDAALALAEASTAYREARQ